MKEPQAWFHSPSARRPQCLAVGALILGGPEGRRRLLFVACAVTGLALATVAYVGSYLQAVLTMRLGLAAALGNTPVTDLLLIVLGVLALAAIVGWLFASGALAAPAHQGIE